jgi:hypothetical protein
MKQRSCPIPVVVAFTSVGSGRTHSITVDQSKNSGEIYPQIAKTSVERLYATPIVRDTMMADALLDYSKGIRFCLEIIDLNERLTQQVLQWIKATTRLITVVSKRLHDSKHNDMMGMEKPLPALLEL